MGSQKWCIRGKMKEVKIGWWRTHLLSQIQCKHPFIMALDEGPLYNFYPNTLGELPSRPSRYVLLGQLFPELGSGCGKLSVS